MKLAHRVPRRPAAAFRLLVFVSAVLTVTAVGQAQTPPGGPAAPLPKKTFTKNNTFDLPIVMDDPLRATLREVCLFVKRPGGDWAKQETAPPQQTRFTHKVPQDGEYWYSLVTIDKQGRMTPGDVNSEPPGLRVVVDTQPPKLDVQPWTGPNGEQGLRCAVQDANPEPQALKAVAQTLAGEQPLEPVPGQPGTFRVQGESLQGTVRVSTADLSGNVASRVVNVKELFPPRQVVAETKVPSVSETPMNMPPTVVSRPDLKPSPEAVKPVVKQGPVIVENQPIATTSAVNPPANAVVPAVVPPPNVMPQSVSTANVAPRNVVPQNAPALADMQPRPPVAPASVNAHAPAQRQLISTTQASVDYRVDQVGPSGIGKVEAYLTSDQGQSWHRLTEDADRNTPIPINLPGEGLFGVRLAITNGNGFGGSPPKLGDTPHCWIEVDTTSPFVQLRPFELLASAAALEIRWTASDKNLGAEPVSLFYRTRPEGPWQLIARGLKNDGVYRWSFPREAGSQFYLKVEVADQAGNVGRAESPSAVVLDTTEPRVSVIGVTGMRAASPNGN